VNKYGFFLTYLSLFPTLAHKLNKQKDNMSNTCDWHDIQSRAAKFAAKWVTETDEKGEAKTFWDDFLREIFNNERRRLAFGGGFCASRFQEKPCPFDFYHGPIY
jgi:hypothetical protein